MKKFLRLKNYIVILLCLSICLLAFIAYFIQVDFKKTVLEKSQQQILAIAEATSRNMASAILNIQSDMETLALNPLIPEYIKQEKNLSEIAQKWLFSIRNTLHRFSAEADTIYMLDKKGCVRSRIPYKENWIGHDYSNKPSVSDVLKNKKPCIKQITTNSNKSAIAISVPIFHKKKFVGALRSLIYFENIGKSLKNIHLGKYGHAELINTKTGMILYHPKKLYNGKNIFHMGYEKCPQNSWERFKKVLQKVTFSNKGIGIFVPLEKHKIIAFSYLGVPKNNWAILVTIPYSEIEGPINKHSLNITILASIAALLIGLGVYFFYNFQKKKFTLEKKTYLLEYLNQYNQHILNSMPYAIIVLNENYNIDFVNQVYKSIFSENIDLYSVSSEKKIKKIAPNSRLGKLLSKMQNNLSIHNEEIELENNKMYSISIIKMNMPENTLVKYLVLIEDITKRNELAKEVQKKETELIHSTRLASLGVMAAGIGHEINQPLTAIMNYSENIKIIYNKHNLQLPNMQNTLEKIISQIRRAANIVKGLKEFTRNAKNKYSLTDANECIEKVIDFLSPQMDLHQINIEKHLGNISKINGNALQLEQVFTNIICNAADSLSEKKNSKRRITIKTIQKTNVVFIEIIDNGIGFSSEYKSKLFDPFFTLKEPGRGTGLGLSISYRIIKEHGGNIIPENLNYKGARFTIELPIH